MRNAAVVTTTPLESNGHQMKSASQTSLSHMAPVLFCLSVFGSLNESLASAAQRLICDPQSLKQSLDQPSAPIVLDVRTQDAYSSGHIPGARWIDANLWRDTTTTQTGLTNHEFWSAQLGAAGLTLDSNVVVVGDSLPEASRAWWLLGYLGLKNVAVLDGGHAAWIGAGYELSTELPKIMPTQIKIDFQSQRLAGIEAVTASADNKKLNCTILDNRSEPEFTGARGVGTRTGHIPGATHFEWTKFTDKSGKLLAADEIKALLKSEGIDLSQPIVAHCQTGGRSSVAVLALEMAGADKVKNYYRGWSEYSGVLTAPVEK